MLVATWSQTRNIVGMPRTFLHWVFSQKWDMVYGFESEMGVNQKNINFILSFCLLLWCIKKCFVAFWIMCLWMELMMICKWIFKWKWKLKWLLYLGMVIVWMESNGIFVFKCDCHWIVGCWWWNGFF